MNDTPMLPMTEAGRALLATVAAAVDGRDNDETMTVDVSWLWTLTHRIDAIEAEAATLDEERLARHLRDVCWYADTDQGRRNCAADILEAYRENK